MITKDKIVNAKEVDFVEKCHYANMYKMRSIKVGGYRDKL
jgi:hypothetical protein